MYAALTIVAAILAIVGIWALLTGSIITGIILLAAIVGPGGYSIAAPRRRV